MARWNNSVVLRRANDIQANLYKRWYDEKVVLCLSDSLINIGVYPDLHSSVEETLAVEKKLMHSYIRGIGYALRTVVAFRRR